MQVSGRWFVPLIVIFILAMVAASVYYGLVR
jgi:hypothetical protein